MDDKQLSQLISTIYDAALEPGKWQTVIDLLAPIIEGRSSFLYKFDTRIQSPTDIVWSSDTDQDYLNQFKNYYVDVCPYPAPIHELRSGCINDEMVISRSDAYKTEYYNDWAKPQGLEPSQVGLKIDIDQHRFLVLGAHVNVKTYDQQALFYERLLDKLMPHMSNALQVANLIHTTNQHLALSNSTLGNLGLAVFLLNHKMQLIDANGLAEDILKRGDLVKRNETTKALEAILAKSSNKLNTAFASCQDREYDRPNDLFTLQSAKDGAPYIAWIKTACQDDYDIPHLDLTNAVVNKGRDNFILIIAQRPSSPRLNDNIIQALLGLTPAEAKLAAALAGGVSLKHYSRRSGISHNTTRNQLKSIFEKTGVSSQAELVGYIWKSYRV